MKKLISDRLLRDTEYFLISKNLPIFPPPEEASGVSSEEL